MSQSGRALRLRKGTRLRCRPARRTVRWVAGGTEISAQRVLRLLARAGHPPFLCKGERIARVVIDLAHKLSDRDLEIAAISRCGRALLSAGRIAPSAGVPTASLAPATADTGADVTCAESTADIAEGADAGQPRGAALTERTEGTHSSVRSTFGRRRRIRRRREAAIARRVGVRVRGVCGCVPNRCSRVRQCTAVGGAALARCCGLEVYPSVDVPWSVGRSRHVGGSHGVGPRTRAASVWCLAFAQCASIGAVARAPIER